MPFRVLPLSALAALMIGAATVNAAHLVWSGLVIAENAEQPKPVDKPLASIEPTLRALFGYNQFEVIGQSRKTLNNGQEDWLATSKYFSLHVDAQGENEAGYELNLQLWQEKELLLETNTKLSESSPLVIKGPQVGGGQLLLVLLIDDELKSEAGTRHRAEPSSKIVSAWRHLTRFFRSKQ